MTIRNRMNSGHQKSPAEVEPKEKHFERIRRRSQASPVLARAAVVVLVVVVIVVVSLSFRSGSHKSQLDDDLSFDEIKFYGMLAHEHKVTFQKRGSKGKPRKTEAVPDVARRKFYVEGNNKVNQPPTRAFRIRGWQKTDKPEEAQVIWTYSAREWWFDKLLNHQRYNHIPYYSSWNQKHHFVSFMLNYSATTGRDIVAVPETYRLDQAEGFAKFEQRLFHQGGLNTPWVLKMPAVNQGRGITMLGPNTPELKGVLEKVEREKGKEEYIIQKYVCNEMTIGNRKFDFRVFWIVASLEPLILMYHDGYLRIGNSEYDEGNFNNTRAHLTTHTGLAEEGKATWDDFAGYVAEVNQKYNLGIKDPIGHVRNQVMQVLGEFAAAFRDVSFNAEEISADNGFGFYGADFIIDWDLDVYFIEPQHGCGLDEDHQFRVEMHNALFTEMIDALEEIWDRQEKGLPVTNADLKKTGDYKIVYNDGWMYEYKGYKRSKNKKGCDIKKPIVSKE